MQNSENEIWKKSFEIFEVSSFGRLRNSKTGFIYPNPNSWVKLANIVAEAFVENPHNYTRVIHIDKDNTNNHFTNLRWGDIKMVARQANTPKNNTSGEKGVSYCARLDRWLACITDTDGKKRTKSFAVKKYPNAFDLAVAWRKAKEIEFGYF